MSNKLTNMAKELLEIEGDLPFRFNYALKPQATINDFEIHIFEQLWGSTALGFGGIGGCAMTTANTYVLIPVSIDENCFVYFAGRFAYTVPCSQVFLEDVRNQRVASVNDSTKYRAQTT